jgi:heme exporter protein D
MNWHSGAEFFAMGGYGLYVWGSYGVAAVLMFAEPWLVSRRHLRARQEAAHAGPEAE